MLVKEILELTFQPGENIPNIAKRLEGVGEKRLREALKNAQCEPIGSGKKGWHFVGEDSDILEKNILEFAPKAALTTKARANVKTKERNNERTKKGNKERTKETTYEQNNEVIRKRASFDIDVNLLKEFKLQAVLQEKKIYELVEQAMRQYLKDIE